MRQEIPAAGAITIVVEPGSEDEVGRCAEEATENVSTKIQLKYLGDLHNDNPGEESPMPARLGVVAHVVFARVLGPPVQSEDVRVVDELEAAELETSAGVLVVVVLFLIPILILICFVLVFRTSTSLLVVDLRLGDVFEALQPAPVGIAPELDHGRRILGLGLRVLAVFSPGQLHQQPVRVRILLLQAGDLGVLFAVAHVIETDDGEGLFDDVSILVAVFRYYRFEAANFEPSCQLKRGKRKVSRCRSVLFFEVPHFMPSRIDAPFRMLQMFSTYVVLTM